MSDNERTPISEDELAAEAATALPDKEVVSLLDLDANIDLAIDAAAPIDLAVAANANVAAPIDAAIGANILSVDSTAQALGDQGVSISQGIVGDTTATGVQDSTIDQAEPAPEEPVGEEPVGDVLPESGTPGLTVDDALSGPLLDVDVNVDADADLAAPIAGAVAANANVAAPIDAAVAANIGSVGSDAVAVADQTAIIEQNIEGDSTATADQESDIGQ